MSATTLLACWLGVVLLALTLRSRFYATFVAVLLAVITLVWVAVLPRSPSNPLYWPALVLQALVLIHFAALARPRLRPWYYRYTVSVPALWFAAGTMLALPWALAAALGLPPYGWQLPYGLALLGLIQSTRARLEHFDLVLDGKPAESLRRYPRGRGGDAEPALRIVHLSDPHLGPFMSEKRLRGICERIAAEDPDLVLLTGDLLTMESQKEIGLVTRALAPLAPLRGRTFACLGNHDLEAVPTVEAAYGHNGIRLLVDEHASVDTRAGGVQIVGVDFVWRGRQEHLREVLATVPDRGDDLLRVVLLHDPWAFVALPEGSGDLVLSGHTHGGQLGLLSVGIDWTILRLFAPGRPDHGFWARGRDRLYISRGAGHYGFPLRVGVPPEVGLVNLHIL